MNLVTGATGIIGSHVVLKLLQNNQKVIACKQKTSQLSKVENLFAYYTTDSKKLFEKITWVDLDICDIFSIEEILEGVNVVYHCAGMVSFNKKDKKNIYNVNEIGTRNIVNACLNKKIITLCHVSSISTINNLDYAFPLNESVFWKKSGKESDYAISKYNAEREVWRGIEEGLNAVIVNPGVVLSPGFWHQSSSKLFNLGFRGNKFYTTGSTGYVSAEDLSIIMLDLVKNRFFSNRYIVVENNYTFQQIFNMIQKNFNKPLPYFKVSITTLKILSKIESIICFFSGRAKILTKPMIYSAFSKQLYSNIKVKTDCLIEFTPIDLVIKRICEKYLIDAENNRL